MATKKIKYLIFTFIFLCFLINVKGQKNDTLYAWANKTDQLRVYRGSSEIYYIHNDTLFFVPKNCKNFNSNNRILISTDSVLAIMHNKGKPSVPFKLITPQYNIVTKIFTYYAEFLDGGYKEFYPNGAIKIIGFYANGGKKTGKWIYYNKNGTVKKTIQY